MFKEYLFYNKSLPEFPLDESIEVVNCIDNITSECLVANIETSKAFIYAPEINYYIDNSQDSINEKIHKIKKLYDSRGASCDFREDREFSQTVGNKLVVISLDETAPFMEELNALDFVKIFLKPDDVLEIKGHIGALHVSFLQDNVALEFVTDQLLWFGMPEAYVKKVGMYDPLLLGVEKTLSTLCANVGEYHYKNFLSYDATTCQYHERRQEICAVCANVCPTGAIVKVDAQRHLQFSHIDCIGCGKCVSVCPSGSLDTVQMPLDALSAMSPYYKNSIVLLLPSKVGIENLHVKLPKGVLPFVVESKDVLSEAHFMTFLQTSLNPILFYTKELSGAILEVVTLINAIFQRKYNKQAIFTCKNEKELQEACEKMESLAECEYGIHQKGMHKREIFSARLAHLVGSENLGKITTGKLVHYGNITIDQDKCTLCFSCIGACNVKALTAHPQDNSLRLNPSLCTSCGYCVASCPEKGCINIIEEELSLEPNYFMQNIMAQDELFKCTQCGKEFATVKSIQKIASIMAPHFGDNPLKMATLYCCAACKPKVMFQESAEKGFLNQ